MSAAQNQSTLTNLSQTKHTLKEAADYIDSSPAPVLFPDTCALVDLVRMLNPRAIAFNFRR